MGVKANAIGAGAGALLFYGVARLCGASTKTKALIAAMGLGAGGVSARFCWTDRAVVPDQEADGALAAAYQKLQSGDSYQIFVKVLNGKTITLRTVDNLTVRELKLFIQEKAGHQADQQRLIFNGKQLGDDYDMAAYDVEVDSTLHLVMRK